MSNVVFYRGPSLLTGEPILALAGGTGSSLRPGVPNRKTGPAVQTYILRSDISPIEAVKSGGDRAICGDCALRGDGQGNERSCYVTYFRNPHNIWKALDKAIDLTPADLSDRIAGEHVRLCAYGDPAAVPMAVWLTALSQAPSWTGYTHQWRRPETQPYRALLMASVNTATEQRQASAMGWRTFRVRAHNERLLQDEVICPASEEANHAATCATCGLCRGLARSAKSIAIYSHGSGMKWFSSAALAAQGARA